MNRSIFFIALLLTLTTVSAQSKQDKQLEKKLDELLSSRFSDAGPGCDVLVAKKGAIVYHKAFGKADIGLNVPIRTGMLFRIGSITKQFTAVAILQLAEQGKLSLQDSIQQYVKDFPSKGKPITIENLLTHTSGLPDYLQLDNAGRNAERLDYTVVEVIDKFKSLPLQFDPGTKFRYSNSGYFLLGCIIEKVSGKSFSTYLRENILSPLGMENTYFESDGLIIPGKVNGYRQEGSAYRNADYMSMTVAYAAGELISNTEDLFKWHQGLYTHRLLKKETLEKAFTPFTLKDGTVTEYGYGWIVRNISGIRSIEHGGAIFGFLTNALYFPAEDVFIAALFNCECAPKDDLSATIAGLAIGKLMQNEIMLDTRLLDTYTGTYTLSTDNKRTIVITREKDGLFAKLSGQGTFSLIFQSETNFQFKNVLGAACEFIKENGKVTRINVSQDGQFVWIKTQ